MWQIEGIYDTSRLTLVTVRPPRELASVEAIALEPAPTPDDPKPRSIEPVKIEPTPDGFGLRAWFRPLRQRFYLRVTLSDGTTHKIDIYALPKIEAPKSEPKPYRYYPAIAAKVGHA
jgi:hypothetical protein